MADAHHDEIAKLETLYAEHPEGRIFTHLAEACRKAGDLERAREVLTEGIERHPDYSSAHVVLGRVLMDEGEYEAARSEFGRVLELDDHNLVAIRSLGDIARAEGRTDDAISFYRDLLELESDSEVRELVEALETGAPLPDVGGPPAPGVAEEEPGAIEAAEEAAGEVPAGGPEGAGEEGEGAAWDEEAWALPAEDEEETEDEAGEIAAEVGGEGEEAPVPDEVEEAPGAGEAGAAEAGAADTAGDEPAFDAAEAAEFMGGPAMGGPTVEEPIGEDSLVDEPLAEQAAEPAAETAEGPTVEEPEEAPWAEGADEAPAAEEPGAEEPASTGVSVEPEESEEPEPEPEEPEESDEWVPYGEPVADAAAVDELDEAGEAGEVDAVDAAAEPEELEAFEQAGETEWEEAVEEPAEPGEFEEELEPAGAETAEDIGAAGAEAPAVEDGDVVTETMAQLYARQGLYDRAVEVYRELVRKRPDDAALQEALAEAEAKLGGEPAAGAPEAEPTPEAEDVEPGLELDGTEGIEAEPVGAEEVVGELEMETREEEQPDVEPLEGLTATQFDDVDEGVTRLEGLEADEIDPETGLARGTEPEPEEAEEPEGVEPWEPEPYEPTPVKAASQDDADWEVISDELWSLEGEPFHAEDDAEEGAGEPGERDDLDEILAEAAGEGQGQDQQVEEPEPESPWTDDAPSSGPDAATPYAWADAEHPEEDGSPPIGEYLAGVIGWDTGSGGAGVEPYDPSADEETGLDGGDADQPVAAGETAATDEDVADDEDAGAAELEGSGSSGGDAGEDEPGDDDDLEMFRSWLESLKP